MLTIFKKFGLENGKTMRTLVITTLKISKDEKGKNVDQH